MIKKEGQLLIYIYALVENQFSQLQENGFSSTFNGWIDMSISTVQKRILEVPRNGA